MRLSDKCRSLWRDYIDEKISFREYEEKLADLTCKQIKLKLNIREVRRNANQKQIFG
jgi:hypothetical protein